MLPTLSIPSALYTLLTITFHQSRLCQGEGYGNLIDYYYKLYNRKPVSINMTMERNITVGLYSLSDEHYQLQRDCVLGVMPVYECRHRTDIRAWSKQTLEVIRGSPNVNWDTVQLDYRMPYNNSETDSAVCNSFFGCLNAGNHDLLMGPFFITQPRQDRFSFSVPFAQRNFMALIAPPTEEMIGFQGLVAVFDAYIWMGFALTVLLTLMVMVCLHRLVPEEKAEYRLWDGLMIYIPGGNANYVRSARLGGNIMLITASLGTIVFAVFYQCAMLKTLLVKTVDTSKDVEYLVQLLSTGGPQLAYRTKGHALEGVIATSDDGLMGQFRDILVNNPPVYDHSPFVDMLAKVIKGEYVYVGDDYYMIEQMNKVDYKECSKVRTVTFGQPQWEAIMLRKNDSDLTEFFSRVILDIYSHMQNMDVTKQLNKACSERLFPAEAATVSYRDLDFNMIASIFFTFLLLNGLACGIMVLEMLHKFYKTRELAKADAPKTVMTKDLVVNPLTSLARVAASAIFIRTDEDIGHTVDAPHCIIVPRSRRHTAWAGVQAEHTNTMAQAFRDRMQRLEAGYSEMEDGRPATNWAGDGEPRKMSTKRESKQYEMHDGTTGHCETCECADRTLLEEDL